jgi:hypothetical protein
MKGILRKGKTGAAWLMIAAIQAVAAVTISVNPSQIIMPVNPYAFAQDQYIPLYEDWQAGKFAGVPSERQMIRESGLKAMRMGVPWGDDGTPLGSFPKVAAFCSELGGLAYYTQFEPNVSPDTAAKAIRLFKEAGISRLHVNIGGECMFTGYDVNTFCNDFPAIYQAIKAADPSVQVSVPLGGGASHNSWDLVMYQRLGNIFDAVEQDFYPNIHKVGLKPNDLLAQSKLVEYMVKEHESHIQQYHPSRAGKVPFVFSEWEAGSDDNSDMMAHSVAGQIAGVNILLEMVRMGSTRLAESYSYDMQGGMSWWAAPFKGITSARYYALDRKSVV